MVSPSVNTWTARGWSRVSGLSNRRSSTPVAPHSAAAATRVPTRIDGGTVSTPSIRRTPGYGLPCVTNRACHRCADAAPATGVWVPRTVPVAGAAAPVWRGAGAAIQCWVCRHGVVGNAMCGSAPRGVTGGRVVWVALRWVWKANVSSSSRVRVATV